MSANGTRHSQGGRPARDIAGIRRVEAQTLFGADHVVVDDFASTAVTAVHVNLARVLAGGVGDDGSTDAVIVATDADDTITTAGGPGPASVQGLGAAITVQFAQAGEDQLEINALAGADAIDATDLLRSSLRLSRADGGHGNDTLLGGPGHDVLTGGNGSDVLFAGSGNNVVLGGAGDDVLLNGEVEFDE